MVSKRKGPQVQLMSCPDSRHGQQRVPHGLKPHTSGGTCKQCRPRLTAKATPALRWLLTRLYLPHPVSAQHQPPQFTLGLNPPPAIDPGPRPSPHPLLRQERRPRAGVRSERAPGGERWHVIYLP